MSYDVLFDGCGTTRVRAACMEQAITTGRSLLERGRRNIIIQPSQGGQAIALTDLESRTKHCSSVSETRSVTL
ncbi:hypothetical protein [Sphingobium sp. TKS]|uniref:hypothetical protein n=1 Tax=Sphingobium sp. TKS TaxID=1315974 RepID=UPI0008369F43|nr:hypothetical protein [Sphingobium sp. TKS]